MSDSNEAKPAEFKAAAAPEVAAQPTGETIDAPPALGVKAPETSAVTPPVIEEGAAPAVSSSAVIEPGAAPVEITPPLPEPTATITPLPEPVGTPTPPSEPVARAKSAVASWEDEQQVRQMRQMSRRSFTVGAVAIVTGYAGWYWLTTRKPIDGQPWPFRTVLGFNERLAESYFSPARLAPTFPISMAEEPRPNGDVGLSDDLDADAWRLTVRGLAGPARERTLTIDDIKALPHVEMVTEHKCVEGWSTVVHWGGARLIDFAAKYPPITRSGSPPDVHGHPEELVRYVSLVTPDEAYYVGLDMQSALHPQTLLCYEMNGAPLTSDHGAPLRLVTPVKYGIKSIKRIGTLVFTDERPKDYWAEQGYDWYAGH